MEDSPINDTRFDNALTTRVFDNVVLNGRLRKKAIRLEEFVKAVVFQVRPFNPGAFYIEWITKCFSKPPKSDADFEQQRVALEEYFRRGEIAIHLVPNPPIPGTTDPSWRTSHPHEFDLKDAWEPYYSKTINGINIWENRQRALFITKSSDMPLAHPVIEDAMPRWLLFFLYSHYAQAHECCYRIRLKLLSYLQDQIQLGVLKSSNGIIEVTEALVESLRYWKAEERAPSDLIAYWRQQMHLEDLRCGYPDTLSICELVIFDGLGKIPAQASDRMRVRAAAYRTISPYKTSGYKLTKNELLEKEPLKTVVERVRMELNSSPITAERKFLKGDTRKPLTDKTLMNWLSGIVDGSFGPRPKRRQEEVEPTKTLSIKIRSCW